MSLTLSGLLPYPDLILGLYAGLTKEEYETLSRIAPTVVQPSEYEWDIPWQQQLLITGRALGREELAEELVSEVEAQFEQAQAAHPEFNGSTAVFVSFSTDGFWIFGPDDIRTQFLTSLGFGLPENTGPLSHERAKELEQDVVIAVTEPSDFESDPLYGQLNVVSEGRVVYLTDWTDDLAAAIGFNSPLSLPYLLDGIVPRLAAAADGNPDTDANP
jgi:iron complex transport system substrate-binding protein